MLSTTRDRVPFHPCGRPGDPETRLRPLAAATALFFAYLALCLILIAAIDWTSDSFRALDHLLACATFCLATGAVFFLIALQLLSRIRAQELQAIEQQQQLLVSEKKALAGLLAASTAHDINNLLTVLVGSLEGQPTTPGAPVGGAWEQVSQAVQRIGDLARRLQRVADAGVPGDSAEFDLIDVVVLARDIARGHRAVRTVAVDVVRREGPTRLLGNPMYLEQAILNLVINAAQADARRIEVRIVGSPEPAAEVHDDGPGIAVEDQEQVFTPFFTNKAEGTGLGLISVKACAEAYGGRVELGSSPLGGACFRIVLGPGAVVGEAGRGIAPSG